LLHGKPVPKYLWHLNHSCSLLVKLWMLPNLSGFSCYIHILCVSKLFGVKNRNSPIFLTVGTMDPNFKTKVLTFCIFPILYRTGGILYELVHGCLATFHYQNLSKQLTGLSKFHANLCLPTDIHSLLSVLLKYWWRQIVRWDKYIIININFINSVINVTMLSNLNHTFRLLNGHLQVF
jgi:hypothetical protein